jgi:predicted MPP superfamily phosphohydrolase
LGGAGTAVLGGVGYALGIEPIWPEVTYFRMPLAGLGPEFQGARIIQLSDLHVGPQVPESFLQKWIDWVSAQEADFVLVTGDSVNYSNSTGTSVMARLLRRLRAQKAVLVTLGNHEWGAWEPYAGMPGLAQRAANAMKQEGIRVLRNQVASFRRGRSELHVVGLDDCWGSNYRPEDAFRQLGSQAPTIIMSHNPDSFPGLVQGPGDWVLAGHTHGGQVNIPFFGPPRLPVRHRQFAAGHYCVGGKNLYVNRGLGWARRVRFNARPEVTVFTLERA